METFVDPEYAYHKAMAQISLELLLAISEPALLPFNVERYAKALVHYGNSLKNKTEGTLANHNISLGKSNYPPLVVVVVFYSL